MTESLGDRTIQSVHWLGSFAQPNPAATQDSCGGPPRRTPSIHPGTGTSETQQSTSSSRPPVGQSQPQRIANLAGSTFRTSVSNSHGQVWDYRSIDRLVATELDSDIVGVFLAHVDLHLFEQDLKLIST